MDPVDLARHIEHTLLRPDATPARVEAHCRAAAAEGLFGVCILPRFVAHARGWLEGSGVRIVTVVAFPLGGSASLAKAAEAHQAVVDGADELDMVMSIGDALAGDFGAVETDVRAVREAVPRHVLKVILETGFLDEGQIAAAARASVRAGADFVKTSTGFGPRGATVADVEQLARVVAGRAQVKASGGIRTRHDALAMLHAGATRIGTSAGVDIVRGP